MPQNALYAILKIDPLHGRECIPIGVLLLDTAGERLLIRFREDLADLVDAADENSLDVLNGLIEHIMDCARTEGAAHLFKRFEDTLSNFLQMGEPHPLSIPSSDDWKATIDRLFNDQIIRRDDPRP